MHVLDSGEGRGQGQTEQDKDGGEEWRQEITAWVRFGRGEGAGTNRTG